MHMSYLKKIEYEITLKDSFWVVRNCPKCGRKTHYINTKKFRVNANTIVRTYEHLGFDGTVRSVKGVGFFVAEGAGEAIKERRRQAFFDELLPLCIRQMELLGISPDEIIPIIKRHENKQ